MKRYWLLIFIMTEPLLAMRRPSAVEVQRITRKLPASMACKPSSFSKTQLKGDIYQDVKPLSLKDKIVQWWFGGKTMRPSLTEQKIIMDQAQRAEKVNKLLHDFEQQVQKSSLAKALTYLEKIPQEQLNKPIPQVIAAVKKTVSRDTGDTVLKRLIAMTGSPIAQKKYLADFNAQWQAAKTPQEKEKLLQAFRKKKNFAPDEQFKIIEFTIKQGANPNYTGFKEISGQEFVDSLPLKVAFDSGNLGAAQALIEGRARVSNSLIKRLENELRDFGSEKQFEQDPRRQALFDQEYKIRKEIVQLVKAHQPTPISRFKGYFAKIF